MKRINRIINLILVLLLVSLYFVNINLALADSPQGGMPNVNEYEPEIEKMPINGVNIVGTIAQFVQIIGIIISVIVILILGIKYFSLSLEGRAEYKKTMISYIVGCALIVGTATIIKVINNLVEQIF